MLTTYQDTKCPTIHSRWFLLLEAQETQLTLHCLPAIWEGSWCSPCPTQWQIHCRALTRPSATKIRDNSSHCNSWRILIDSSHVREVAAVHTSTCDNLTLLQLSASIGISWTSLFIKASKSCHSFSSFSQHRWSLLPNARCSDCFQWSN